MNKVRRKNAAFSFTTAIPLSSTSIPNKRSADFHFQCGNAA
ncbi:hypothetical protein [uncultured Mitsuokella sp.]|nr:hypothetical protein [uncultured Mitsuokella sp.]